MTITEAIIIQNNRTHKMRICFSFGYLNIFYIHKEII